MKAPAPLAHMAIPGTLLQVRVTPKAARNQGIAEGKIIKAQVTTVPEDGKATAAVVALLAKAPGLRKSRLEPVRGATSRDKQVQLL